jgi:hypothetical protein
VKLAWESDVKFWQAVLAIAQSSYFSAKNIERVRQILSVLHEVEYSGVVRLLLGPL